MCNFQVALGLDVPKWANPILARLGEASRLAYRLYFKTDEMKKIGGGKLLFLVISLNGRSMRLRDQEWSIGRSDRLSARWTDYLRKVISLS